MNKYINCLCGKEYKENDFKKHFQKCRLFKEKFNKLDSNLSILLKINSNTKEDLIFLKFLLKRYIEIIENKLNIFENINKIIQDNNNNDIEIDNKD